MTGSAEDKTMATHEDDPKCADETLILSMELTQLQNKLSSLTQMAADKDEILNKLSKDKIQLLTELKREQSLNKHLKRRLELERCAYLKDKEQYCMEMYRHKRNKKSWKVKHVSSRLHSEKIAFVQEDNEELKKRVNERDRTTYSLCVIYLRMKIHKDLLEMRLTQLENKYMSTMTEMLAKLTECKAQLYTVADDDKPPHKTNALLLQIAQHNSRIMLENAVLKLEVHKLKSFLSDRTLQRLYKSRLRYLDETQGKRFRKTSKVTVTAVGDDMESLLTRSGSCQQEIQLKPTRSRSY